MEIDVVKGFFLWSTVINFVLLTISFLICSCAGDFVYRMHDKWFPMTKETFTVAIYSLLGFYKCIWILFNFVPYLAIVIAA